jgi:hypothetical protein
MKSVKQNADVTVSPLRPYANAKIRLAHPTMVFFIKYEFGQTLMIKRTTNTNLFSFRNIQRKNVFKWYGTFYRTLDAFTYFFAE